MLGVGDSKIAPQDHVFVLMNVLYPFAIRSDLVSMSVLDETGYDIKFSSSHVPVTGEKVDGMYSVLNFVNDMTISPEAPIY